MLKSSWYTINIIITTICMAFIGALYALGITEMAHMFVAATCLFGSLVIIPLSLFRIQKHTNLIQNLLIVLSTNIISLLLLFIIITFVYLGLFSGTMFTFFELVFYPSTLAILLLEYIIAYLNNTKFQNSIQYANVSQEDM